MSETLNYRRYTPADRDACIAVCQSVVPHYVRPHEVSDFTGFLDTLTANGCHYVVVQRGAGPVIAVGGVAIEGPVATLCWGLVHADHHKTGLGRWLLETRLDWLRSDPQVTRVKLCTTQHTDGFFAHFGFEVVATEVDHFAPGLDRVDMVLQLEDEGAATPPAT